jgi:hypothetical protein
VVHSTFSQEEVEYLLKDALPNTEEIPYNTPKKLHRRSRVCRVEHVEFEKFRIRLTFPQNTVKLRDGRVLFCDKFDLDNSGIQLIGRFVEPEIREAFPGSLEVGCGLVEMGEGTTPCLSTERMSVNASEVRSKCSLFPAVPVDFVLSEDLLKNPEKVLHPESFGNWIVVDMVP